MALIVAQAPGYPPGLDWQQLAAVYGPLVGVLAVVLKMHWDMLHKTIPVALRALRGELRKNRHVVTVMLQELRDVEVCRGRNERKPRAPARRTRKRKRDQRNTP